MASPITWQSLSNHNLPDPTKLMALGQEGINAGMAGFQKMADNYLQGQQNIADKAKVDNLASLKQGLFGKTVAELEADQASGAYGQRIAGFGKNVDALAAQAFMEERLSKVKQNDTANWAYQNAATDQAQAPLRDELIAAINRNDPLTANIIKSGNPTLRNMAAIEAAQTQAARQLTLDDRAKTTFANQQSDQTMQEALHPGAVELQQAQINASKAATAEKDMSSGLNKLLLQHNQGYGADINSWNSNVKAIGQEMKLPVNAATGMPDLSAVNPETLKAFKTRIGTPPSSSERLAVFKQQMSDASVPLEQQVKAEVLFDKAFGTGASISEVDQKNLETKTKQLDERLAARKKSSMLYSGSEEERQAEMVATNSFFDTNNKDTWFMGSHREFVNDTMLNGLKIKDAQGNPVTATVTPKMMKLALSSSQDKNSNWFNTTEGQVTAFLKDYIETPAYAKEVALAAEIEADPTGAAAKKKLVDSYMRPTMGTGPVQFMNSLTDTIDSANARAQAEAAKAQKKTQ